MFKYIKSLVSCLFVVRVCSLFSFIWGPYGRLTLVEMYVSTWVSSRHEVYH